MFSGGTSFRQYVRSSMVSLQFDEKAVLETLAETVVKMPHQQNGLPAGSPAVAHQQNEAIAVAHEQNGTAAVAHQQNGAVAVAHQQDGAVAVAHQQNGAAATESSHEKEPRHHLVASLTKGIADIYKICDPNFKVAPERRRRPPSPSLEFLSDELDYEEPYPTITPEEVLNVVLEDDQRRYLTFPSDAVSNDGFDNINDDLILYSGLVLQNSASNTQYVVKEMLGQGSFGQVCRCTASDQKCEREVAVKVVKNRQEYAYQAALELHICTSLTTPDPRCQDHIVQILDYFVFADHVCLVFELLSIDLYEVLKTNKHKGLSIRLVSMLTTQMLKALTALQEARVIHGDLKPENIVLKLDWQRPEIKLIDFGSSYVESIGREYLYSYMMSRHYRAPEVLLKMRWSFPIDMWSAGCIAAELFLGIPLLPAECEYDLLRFMIEVLECQPPDHMIQKHLSNKEKFKFFKLTSSAPISKRGDGGQSSPFQFLTFAEVAERERARCSETRPREWDMSKVGKNYHGDRKTLSEIILDCPIRRQMTISEQTAEPYFRVSFVHFLRGILCFDPDNRWTPSEALQHPFITGEPFSPSFKPLPDPKRRRDNSFQTQGVVLDHNFRHGHWISASPSHQLLQPLLPNGGTNPGYQAHRTPYNDDGHSGAGSNGMQVDNPPLGSSPRSFGDYPPPILCRSGPYGTGPGPGVNGFNQGGVPVPHLLAPGFVGSPDTFSQGRNVSNASAQSEAVLVHHQLMFPLGATPSHNPPYYYASPLNSIGSGYASPYSFALSPWANASPASTFLYSASSQFSSPPSNPVSMHNSPISRFAFASLSPGNRADHRSAAQISPQSRHWPNCSPHQWQGNQNPNNNVNEALIRGHHVSTSYPPRHRNSSNGYPAAHPYRHRRTLGALFHTGPDGRYDENTPPPDRRDNHQGSIGIETQQHPGAPSSSSNVTSMEVNEVSNGISRLATRGK